MNLFKTTLCLVLLVLAPLALAQPPLVIGAPDTLPIAMQGKPYSFNFTAAGGVGPYTWNATGLPAGLGVSALGMLTGVPTEPAVAIVALAVTDSTGATATKAIGLTVQHVWGPYDVPEPITVCQMKPDNSGPAIDPALGVPKCFIVPLPLSQTMTKYLLTQTDGLDQAGNVKYHYANWWDYIVKFFVNNSALPVMDMFPSPEIAAAKAAAEAAQKAVDAAKAALIGAQQQQ